jgi:hypothetical protein
MRTFTRSVATVALLGALAFSIGASQSSKSSSGKTPPTVLHFLGPDSEYTWGCFPAPPFPCAGPVFLASDFEGIFGLTFAGIDAEGFRLFEVSNVLLVASFGPEDSVLIMGEGLYRRRLGDDPMHELTLNVTVDGGPVIFDSGVVPVPDSDAAIDIDVNMNGLMNYDILMRIVADPFCSPALELAPDLGGSSVAPAGRVR